MAKRFFYVCAGILMLALSYHFGAQSAGAQSTGNPVVAFISTGDGGLAAAVVTVDGDVYGTSNFAAWTHLSNVFTSTGPTSAQQESFGSLKARYRK